MRSSESSLSRGTRTNNIVFRSRLSLGTQYTNGHVSRDISRHGRTTILCRTYIWYAYAGHILCR